MKKQILCLLLAVLMLFCLLAGCGDEEEEDDVLIDTIVVDNEDDSQEDGADWRTQKAYYYAVVNHDGDINLVLDITAEGATIYYDDETQTVYDAVTFPYVSLDEWTTANNLNVVDYNEDGYDDLFFSLCYSNTEDSIATEEVLYLWNPEAGCFELGDNELEGLAESEDSEEETAFVSYMDENGLYWDMSVYDDCEVTLDDGLFIYSTDVDYTTIPIGITFTVLNDTVEGDTRTLEVQKDITIYQQDVPTLNGSYIYYGYLEKFFDGWTGKNFDFGASDGTTHAYCEWIVDTGSEMFTVSCSRDIEWEKNINKDGKWAVCHASYVLEVPCDYDGFTMVVCPESDTRYEMEYYTDYDIPEYFLDNTDDYNSRLLRGIFISFN